MKWLVLWAVLAVAYAWWKHQRRTEAARPSPTPTTAKQPAPLVHCQVCGVSVPASEAVIGRQGPYCGIEHQQRAEP